MQVAVGGREGTVSRDILMIQLIGFGLVQFNCEGEGGIKDDSDLQLR